MRFTYVVSHSKFSHVLNYHTCGIDGILLSLPEISCGRWDPCWDCLESGMREIESCSCICSLLIKFRRINRMIPDEMIIH